MNILVDWLKPNPFPRSLIDLQQLETVSDEDDIIKRNRTAALVLAYVQKITQEKHPCNLNREQILELLSKLPSNTFIFHGGSQEDLGEDWTFIFFQALSYSRIDGSGRNRKNPTLMVMTVGDLIAAINKYLEKTGDYNVIGPGNQWYAIKIGLKDIKKAGIFLPTIVNYPVR